MLESLIELDKELLLFCNGIHFAWLDTFNWIVSQRYFNMFLIVPLLFLLLQGSKWREFLLVVVGLAVVILLCDQFASSVCKPIFHRFRPTHDESIARFVHVVNDYRGGRYGFISSHSANAFGAAVFLLCVFRNRWFTVSILLWALMVGYSRIYLGVHFPGDILAGAVAGILIGWGMYCVYKRLRVRLYAAQKLSSEEIPYRRDSYVTYFAAYILLMFFVVALVSVCML